MRPTLAPFGACVARARGTSTPRKPGCKNATRLSAAWVPRVYPMSTMKARLQERHTLWCLLSNTRQSQHCLQQEACEHRTQTSPHLSIAFFHLMIALRRFCPKSMAVTTPLCLPRRVRTAVLTIGFAREHAGGRSAASPSEDSTRQCCKRNQQLDRTARAKLRTFCP